MNARELALALRHIAEKLGGGGDIAEAVDELWELADELDPDSSNDLLSVVDVSYVGED